MEFDLQLAINCAETFSRASGLGCVLADGRGTVLHACGRGYTRCRICEYAGQDHGRCALAHRYGLQEAERFGGKYIYYCHMGLTCFTSPVMGEHGAVAQITAGPFLMGDVQDYIACDLNDIVQNAPERLPGIMDEIKGMAQVEESRVNALSELLFMTVAFFENAAQTRRMLDNEQSVYIQGQISDYLFHIKQSEAPSPYPFRDEKRFLQALGKGDQKQAQALLNELLGYILFETGGNMSLIHNRVHELLVLSSRTVIESGGDPVYVDGLLQKYRQNMPQMQTMEQLSLWLSRVIRALVTDQLSNQKARHSDLIYRTIQYLQSNYSRKLTLDEVADHVHISPTYLSRVFKRETGASMVDFLNRIRIEKSKELLMDDKLRLIEVALQSGFESQSYFNRMFRQSSGMTPQQYRKLMTNS